MDPDKNRKTPFDIEDIAVRVMYLLNTMDSFLLLSTGLFIGLSRYLGPGQVVDAPLPVIAVVYFIIYAIFRAADFHPLFLVLTPLYIFFIRRLDPQFPGEIFTSFLLMFVFTSFVQVVFMGIPMSLAARRADIPVRIYLNSFLILAPTTISMPLTIYYQLLLISSTKSIAQNALRPESIILLALFVVGMVIARRFRKKHFIPPVSHPEPAKKLFSRVIILNIDGLSHHAFSKANAPFLKGLEDKYVSVKGGAHTVYRALTNPAFASILSGSLPEKHKVFNNNMGQRIKTEALPDFIDTRLYGSMHVKHFSRDEWKVRTVSLVKSGFDKADAVIMDDVKHDMKAFPETELWVVDLSLVDYTGHSWGTYSKEYIGSIGKMDGLIKEFFGWLETESLAKDSMIIISSDHGMFIEEHSFIISSQEERVPLIFAGNGIARKIIDEKVSILDIAANVSYCLGKRYCKESGGRAFTDIFACKDKVGI